MSTKLRNKLYSDESHVVWIRKKDGWWPQQTAPRDKADEVAHEFRGEGFKVQIHPRHTNSLEDIIEG